MSADSLCLCGSRDFARGFAYDAPPEGETRFAFGDVYARAYLSCRRCGHWLSQHELDLTRLYEGAYAEATYGDRMRESFQRIMSLPPERSDNAGRAARIVAFARDFLPSLPRPPRLLDVGSGLAVFPARMRACGWDCTAVDPDPEAAAHAREVAGVAAIAADFRSLDHAALGRFEAVTFNKVLEHVEEPADMLAAAAGLLEPHGFVYVEVPDVAAAAEGPGREEFFVEHLHVFSPASLAVLVDRSGLSLAQLERLREPSGKFTLRAFAVSPGSDGLGGSA